MAKAFLPAAQVPRPASPVNHGPAVAAATDAAVLKTLVDMEAQSQEMKAEYQHLQALIQKMPQATGQSWFGSAASFGWLAGFIASVGLAASVGVAAVRKYTGHGRHGSDSISDSQISLVPQRA